MREFQAEPRPLPWQDAEKVRQQRSQSLGAITYAQYAPAPRSFGPCWTAILSLLPKKLEGREFGVVQGRTSGKVFFSSLLGGWWIA